MLGPSGSGKTTCLRLIAGFEQPTAGHIEIFGETAEGVPPYRRNVNTVFQDYALFPHMNVLDNVAYGLMIKGVGKAERERQGARPLLAWSSSPAMGARARPALRRPAPARGARPRAGQRAEGAAARRAARRARPQAARADAGGAEGAAEQLGITFVFVTHDQGEALSMADRVAVFNDGRIVQVGAPGGDLRAAAHALRRRFRRLLQRAAAAISPRAMAATAQLGQPAAGEDRRARRRHERRRRRPHASTARSRMITITAPSPRSSVDDRRHAAACRPCRRRRATAEHGDGVRLVWPRPAMRSI